jgi:superfamily II DNA helicase RecQ
VTFQGSELLQPAFNHDQLIAAINKQVSESINTNILPAVQSIFSDMSRNQFYPQDSATQRPTQISVHPSRRNILAALHPQIHNIQFTSPQQAELLEASMGGLHIFGVLPTGGGKSIAIFGPALIDPSCLIVAITPFIALTDDLDRRLSGTTIPGGKWRSLTDPHSARIVLVSAHEAGSDDFVPWLFAVKSRLRRIVIDEAHHILLSLHYRPCFAFFHLMTQLGVPFTFLSATLMPISIPAICKAMSIPLSLTQVIRASTRRPNIQLNVIKVDRQDIFTHVKNLFDSITLLPGEKGLIFCTTRDDCKTLAALLEIPYYIGPMDSEDHVKNNAIKSSLDHSWRSGETPWLVCTMCFGQGIDEPSVRYVINVEARSLVNAFQEIGRAGRDGKPSFSYFFYSHLPSLSGITGDDHAGVLEMRNYLETNQCRQLTLGVFDEVRPHSCAAVANSQLCDMCLGTVVCL